MTLRHPGRLACRLVSLGSHHLARPKGPQLGRWGPCRTAYRLRFSTQGSRRQETPREDGPSFSPEPSLLSKMVESAATTFASILVLGLGFAGAGYLYHKSYKMLVLQKMTNAFEPGDPVLELATAGKEIPKGGSGEHWIVRSEQEHVDDIVFGNDVGHYHLMIGDKGCGKSSMLIEAMRKIDGEGVAMFEAHADLEIFRIRLGKALDYEYHEDYIGGYFSERGPRESTALLDIERALNKLEKVAMVKRRERGKPLIVIVNQMHLLRDDEDGRDLIELLQQRAEQWAAANLVTMVFNSDDYWVYERFKQLATRMEVMSVVDLPKAHAVSALQRYRLKYFGERMSDEQLEDVYERVGGRLSFLSRVAKSSDMLATCEEIKDIEKRWFLNQCWILGMEMDDDVMDQQKWAAAAMVLAKALVEKDEEEPSYDAVVGHLLPTYPFHKAQEIMTRCDFIRKLDSLNLFSITSKADVRASSVPMHIAFKEICAEPNFDEHLELTIQRISDIESLGRTRELVAKDLVLAFRFRIILEGGLSMPANSKWPDFRLASTLWSLVGSQASGSDKPPTSDGASLQTEAHDREQHDELTLSDDRDGRRNRSPKAADAMMDPEGEPIDGMESFDHYEHDAQIDDVPDHEPDFGTLEMFDSNATQAPYTTQVPPSSFEPSSKAPEAMMEESAPSSHSTKSKREKKERKKKGTSYESASSPQLSAEDGSRKPRKSKKKTSALFEIPDSPPIESASDVPQEQLVDADTASNENPNEETSVPSTQPKRKRGTSDASGSKLRKKRRAHEPEVETASQDVVQGTPDDESPDVQNSPSAAHHQRRSRSRDARSQENAVHNDEMDLDSQPNAQANQGDSSDQDLGTDSNAVNGPVPAEGPVADPDVESLAREAWAEHVNNGQGQNGGDVYDVPGSPIEAPNPPSSNTKRPRQPKPRKAKPTFFENPPAPEDEAFGEMPSPSVTAPKPRRAKSASKKKKVKAERAPPPSSMEGAFEDGTEGSQGRRNRMSGFTQGRFSDEELNRIAMAVESFRGERNWPQHQVNEMIHAPGGTTAGDEHAALWGRIFETCPDRHRQKIINITRKKFHNFVARGTWTPEQDAELRDLIEVHGTKWSKIAGIINRHPEDLRDRYRNYIVCGDAQRKDSWDEDEEGRLTKYVMEAMGAIDELRRIQPSRELLKKPYEELIDWQNISERMERTRSRLQCITKWKAMNIKTHGKDKLASHGPDAHISFRLEKARRQLADMPEEERYRLLLAIHGMSVSAESKISWQKLVDKPFRNRWHRATQMLLWRRLKQTVPGWEEKNVRDCAQYLVSQYNQMGEMPDVRDEGYNDAQEMEFIGTIPISMASNGATNNISDEFVHNSDVEGEGGPEGEFVEDFKMDFESVGVPDENIQPDLPIEPMELIEPLETIQPDLPVEPMEHTEPVEAAQAAEIAEPVEPIEIELELAEPAPPKATRSAKKSAPGKSRAPRRSTTAKRTPAKTPAKRVSARRAAAPSQDPIEDDDGFLAPPAAAATDNSDVEDARSLKKKTPSKFRATNDAQTRDDDSDSVMDDMEDLPARVSN
ncbi:hypothetical protein B0J13DRAFT_597584 [Dactylonectria estremocensis]|uniref:Uncharacterized protein n=1 Tax=Dactylonectria estremocensis TaxID=1079267 RepID=A0A9P9EB71_9HYPO|nr:hypothetical protein B0J13DRAFT_597584 [Dactylonectria estremocensis]